MILMMKTKQGTIAINTNHIEQLIEHSMEGEGVNYDYLIRTSSAMVIPMINAVLPFMKLVELMRNPSNEIFEI